MISGIQGRFLRVNALLAAKPIPTTTVFKQTINTFAAPIVIAKLLKSSKRKLEKYVSQWSTGELKFSIREFTKLNKTNEKLKQMMIEQNVLSQLFDLIRNFQKEKVKKTVKKRQISNKNRRKSISLLENLSIPK
jgi:hypothetical protein